MGVYQRPDSPYWWMYIETAPKGRRNVSTKIQIGFTATERKESRADAETQWRSRSTSPDEPEPPAEPDLVTFDTFISWYETNVMPHHRGHEREQSTLPRLRAAFGHLHLTDPTWKAAVLAWRSTRRTTGTIIKHFGGPKGKPRRLPPPCASTVNREVDLLQQILSAAVAAGHLDVSPLYGLANLEIVKPTRRIMGEAEERAIAAELSPEDYAILLVGLDALVRLGDILDLRRADDHGTMLDIRNPKNGDPLTVPVSTRLRAALDAVPIDPKHPLWYFPGRRGAVTERDRRGGYAKALKRACERADVPYGRAKRGITFHWSTRRTGATRMIRKGGEKAIGVVQQIGGWKDPTVLIGIYQETITAEMQAAVETVAPSTKKAGALKLVPLSPKPFTIRLRSRGESPK